MSSGKNPLVLMMALSMPGAAHALGLGDIHVDSALNERLAAEIDIVGATALELIDLKAAVASREIFVRYGAERPAFLASTTFKVTQDSQGRPVLAVRSSESFTEPVVNFLVDLNWHNGQLIRQYTLLLDPAGSGAPAAPAATPAAVATAAPTVAPAPPATPVPAATLTPAFDVKPAVAPAARKMTHIKVGAKATLRGIAWRVGERSESDLQRMMLAIFRANPGAFDGNINRLHRGALLAIPSRAELAAIPRAEAKREIRAQMNAWRAPAPQVVAPAAAIAPAIVAPTAPSPAVAAQAPAVAPAAADRGAEAAALGHRVQSLEQELSQMQGLLQSEGDQLLSLQRQAAQAGKPVAAAVAAAAMPQTQSKSPIMAMVSVIAGLAALGTALVAALLRFRRRPSANGSLSGNLAPAPESLDDAAAVPVVTDAPDGMQVPGSAAHAVAVEEPAAGHTDTEEESNPAVDPDATHPALPALPEVEPAGRSEISTNQPPGGTLDATTINAPHDPTVNMLLQTVNLHMDTARLDHNFLDLDLTAQHVQMPSVLNEHAVVKERRTNLADVLKMAIEREPDRHDLRMKLLELYFSAAATNRKAFLDVVQKMARDRDHMQAEQWDRIALMGRQIAAENPLFAEQPDDEDLADCA